MSREAYQPPTAPPASNPAFSQPTGGGISSSESTGPSVWYQCGDCDAKVSLKRGDHIRCKDCGHRVLYKERTKRMVQFEAR
ncbi:MAG: hypothetical protein M1825_003692 [Sarcosagium campestre]|nr:MAG: hypothetical protein M1825_003692 [Sarcosagium campestre]